MELKLVVRYLDGRLVKGKTINFNPAAPNFTITFLDGDASAAPLVVWLKDVKAVFFVRTFEGNRRYEERKSFRQGDAFQGRRLEITFPDGEVMVGSSPNYTPGAPGFFLFPVDSGANTVKAWIPGGSVRNVKFLT